MEHSLFIVMVFVVIVKGFNAKTGVANNVSHTEPSYHIMLDNILRLERVVTNMSWELEITKTGLKTTQSDLKITKTNLESTKTDLVSTKTALKSTEKKLASALSRLARLDAIEEQIQEVVNVTEKLGHEKDFSFQVKLMKHPYTAGRHEPLKFDFITMNKGYGYNPTSGIFRVPRKGNYLCWSNILSLDKNVFAMRLMKEGQEMMRGFTGWDQRPGTITINYLMACKKGDNVWFDLRDSTGIFGRGHSSYGCSMMHI